MTTIVTSITCKQLLLVIFARMNIYGQIPGPEHSIFVTNPFKGVASTLCAVRRNMCEAHDRVVKRRTGVGYQWVWGGYTGNGAIWRYFNYNLPMQECCISKH